MFRALFLTPNLKRILFSDNINDLRGFRIKRKQKHQLNVSIKQKTLIILSLKYSRPPQN